MEVVKEIPNHCLSPWAAVVRVDTALRALLRSGGSRRRSGSRRLGVHMPHVPVVVGLEGCKGCQWPRQRAEFGVQFHLAHLQELVLVKQPGALAAVEPPLNGAPLVVALLPQLGDRRTIPMIRSNLPSGCSQWAELQQRGQWTLSFSQQPSLGQLEWWFPSRFVPRYSMDWLPSHTGRPSSFWVLSNYRCLPLDCYIGLRIPNLLVGQISGFSAWRECSELSDLGRGLVLKSTPWFAWPLVAVCLAAALLLASLRLRDFRCASAQVSQRVWPGIAGLRQRVQSPRTFASCTLFF